MCFTTPFLTITGDCSGETPLSSIVLDRLPGISLKIAANVADESYVRGVTMLRALEEDAINDVRFDILDMLSAKYSFKSVISQERLGWRTDNFSEVTDEVGIQIKRDTMRGMYMSMQLPAIEVQVGEDVASAVFTINVDGTETTRTVDLFKDKANLIELDIEATELIRITWTPNALVGTSVYGRTGTDCGEHYCGGCLEVRNVIGPSYDISGIPSGIIADVSCRVSECVVLKHFLREFAQLLRLRVGIKVMQEIIMSNRANPIVQNSKDSAREILSHWDGGVDIATGEERKGEYYKRLKQLSKMIEKTLDAYMTKGFECERFRLVSAIP